MDFLQVSSFPQPNAFESNPNCFADQYFIFLKLMSNVPLYRCIGLLSIHQSKDIWVDSTLEQLCIELLQKFVYYLSIISIFHFSNSKRYVVLSYHSFNMHFITGVIFMCLCHSCIFDFVSVQIFSLVLNWFVLHRDHVLSPSEPTSIPSERICSADVPTSSHSWTSMV